MSEDGRTVVTVEIAGDEYTIRADATPDYTLECARYVDDTIATIERQGALVEVQKAAILAALSITDQLFQARAEAESLRREIARLAGELTDDIQSRLGAQDLASHP